MTTLNQANMYEIDRLDDSQAIVVKHTVDHSSALPLVMGLLAYVLILLLCMSTLLFTLS